MALGVGAGDGWRRALMWMVAQRRWMEMVVAGLQRRTTTPAWPRQRPEVEEVVGEKRDGDMARPDRIPPAPRDFVPLLSSALCDLALFLLFFLHKKVLPLLYLAPWLLLFISHKSLLPSLLFFTLLDSHIDGILTIISAFAHISAR